MRKIITRYGFPCGLSLALLGMSNTGHAFDLNVFGDVSYIDSNAPDTATTFKVGDLDFYGSQKISNNTRTLFEALYENEGDEWELDVERFEITRDFSDAFHLSAGRFHAPLGFWNHHYHHGILTQDTVSRPAIVAFEHEHGILPMHLIGLEAMGNVGGGFAYEAAIGNSNAFDTSPTGPGHLIVPGTQDLSNAKSMYGHLIYNLPNVDARAGLFFMNNDLLEASESGLVPLGETLIQQGLFGIDLRYEGDRFATLAEYYHLRNDAQAGVGDGASHTSEAYFIQLCYEVAEKLKLVYRFETLAFDYRPGDQDPYYVDFLDLAPERRNIYGLRYDLDDSNALMLEYKRKNPQGHDNINTVTLNWSFVIF